MSFTEWLEQLTWQQAILLLLATFLICVFNAWLGRVTRRWETEPHPRTRRRNYRVGGSL